MNPLEPIAREELKLKNYERGLELFQRINSRGEYEAEVRECLFMITVKKAFLQLKEESFEEARKTYREALGLSFNTLFCEEAIRFCNFRILFEEAHILSDRKDFEGAILYYEKALEFAELPFSHPDFNLSARRICIDIPSRKLIARSQHHLTKAEAAKKSQDWLKARNIFKEIQALYPQFPRIASRIKEMDDLLKEEYKEFGRQGDQLYKSGRLLEARKAYEKAYRIRRSKKVKSRIVDCINSQAGNMLLQFEEGGKLPQIQQINLPYFDLKDLKAFHKRNLSLGYFPANVIAEIFDKNEPEEDGDGDSTGNN